MPNHITNRLTLLNVPSERLEQFIQKYSTHYPSKIDRDYNGFIIYYNKKNDLYGWYDETTETMHLRNGELFDGVWENWEICMTEAYDKFPDFDKIIPHPRCDAYNDLPNQQVAQLSSDWWYTWNRANWGTKWNCYSCKRVAENIFQFNTAWNAVTDLMVELSRQNPDLTIEYAYADENLGCNTGKHTIVNGELIESSIPKNNSKKAYEILFEVMPKTREQFELVGNNYRMIEG